MATTKRNAMLIEEARDKIRTTQLINRLQNHALGEIEMSPTQVRAVEILLKKRIPDLQSTQITGDPDNPLSVSSLSPEQRADEARKLIDETFGSVIGVSKGTETVQ